MLSPQQKLAIFMEGELTGYAGKMGFGVLRYSQNDVVAVVDSVHAGQNVQQVIQTPRSCPVVASVAEAKALGADVLVIGIAPPGGLLPPAWKLVMDEAVALGLSIINGLHDLLAPEYPNLQPGQWVWDIRQEPQGLDTATGVAARLHNRRLLMIGTDMAIGKMTAGLEIHSAALASGVRSAFVATGQIGITITGNGIPLDAIRVDYASGAVEREVLRYADSALVIVEGQGALDHPASTSTLPLLRGSMPTHLVLCHKAGQTALRRHPEILIPPLAAYCRLYEDLAEACGTFPRPKTVGVALNTSHLGAEEALIAMAKVADEVGVICTDPVRFGASALVNAVMD